jgi:pectin methylesterase-like acyl-CoA thioesterase
MMCTLIALACMLTMPAAAGVTIHVDCTNDTGVEDGSELHPYDTIQEGIDAALDGDTVLVQPCTYYENVDFLGKAITVTGTDPHDTAVVAQTVIDACAVGSVVYFVSGESSESVLEGFTITNGYSTWGGGINCDGSGPTIRHNIISHNFANEGGGMRCANSSAMITDNCIIKNGAFGIYADTCLYTVTVSVVSVQWHRSSLK